ncbi:hypothetical protein M9H77_20743 [Catharanthus roseus]|uniref:Uncharacterized protein n=1 Tax=Catharanthus roseus TaxID=4058 RepID=A0ACC0AKL2_CATRO|nr:hypothetical protein M9H77_20743 [Catharanthus roseus]
MDNDDDVVFMGLGGNLKPHPSIQSSLGVRRQRKRGNSSSMLDSQTFQEYFDAVIWRKLPQDKKNGVYCLDSLFFNMYYNKKDKASLLNLIKKKDIFSNKYIIVPIVMWGHWSVLVLCHFGEELEDKAPSMLLLDSMQSANNGLQAEIRKHNVHKESCFVLMIRFVFDLCTLKKGEISIQTINKIPLLVPKVPQQRGSVECGWYCLLFIKLFIENAPEEFKVDGFPYFIIKNDCLMLNMGAVEMVLQMNMDWFSLEEFEEFRKVLCDKKVDVVPNFGQKEMRPDLGVSDVIIDDYVKVICTDGGDGMVIEDDEQNINEANIVSLEPEKQLEIPLVEAENPSVIGKQPFQQSEIPSNDIKKENQFPEIPSQTVCNEECMDEQNNRDEELNNGDGFVDSNCELSDNDALCDVLVEAKLRNFDENASQEAQELGQERRVDDCYSINAHKKTYERINNPTNGQNNWPKSVKLELQAPAKLKVPGHPNGKRRRETGENDYMNSEGEVQRIKGAVLSQRYHCSNCGKIGHNKRKCNEKPAANQGEKSENVTSSHSMKRCQSYRELGHNKRSCKNGLKDDTTIQAADLLPNQSAEPEKEANPTSPREAQMQPHSSLPIEDASTRNQIVSNTKKTREPVPKVRTVLAQINKEEQHRSLARTEERSSGAASSLWATRNGGPRTLEISSAAAELHSITAAKECRSQEEVVVDLELVYFLSKARREHVAAVGAGRKRSCSNLVAYTRQLRPPVGSKMFLHLGHLPPAQTSSRLQNITPPGPSSSSPTTDGSAPSAGPEPLGPTSSPVSDGHSPVTAPTDLATLGPSSSPVPKVFSPYIGPAHLGPPSSPATHGSPPHNPTASSLLPGLAISSASPMAPSRPLL